MRRGELLDEFLEWVRSTSESVRTTGDMLAREGKWGIASACWQAKLRTIQEDLERLELDVSRCVATRDTNRLLFGPEEESNERVAQAIAKHISPKTATVIPFSRARVRSSAR